MSTTTVLDPFLMSQLSTRSNPYPTYQQMLAESPVHFNEATGGWYVTRYDDVVEGLKHPAVSANRLMPIYRRLPEAAQQQFKALFEAFGVWILLMDAPEHTPLRKLTSAPFVPRLINSMRPQVQRLVDEMIDTAIAAHPGEFDVIDDLSFEMPATIIAEMLGASPDDRDQIKAWSTQLINLFGASAMTPDVLMGAQSAIIGMKDYFSAIIAERRAHPADDLITGLIQAEVDGRRLTDEELQATATLLIFAGHETTTNVVATAMMILGQNPELLAKLVADPLLVPLFVEESLRYEAPVQRIARATTAEVIIRDVTIPAGQRVFFMVGAANRDPHVFASPDVFDIYRENNKQHISFGYGLHYCVGATLGRLETQIAIQALVECLPILRLTSPIVWKDNHTLRSLERVKLRYDPV